MSGFTRLTPVIVGTNFPNGVCDALISNWDGQTATLVMEAGGSVTVPLVTGVNPYRCTQVAALGYGGGGSLWAAYEVVVPP